LFDRIWHFIYDRGFQSILISLAFFFVFFCIFIVQNKTYNNQSSKADKGERGKETEKIRIDYRSRSVLQNKFGGIQKSKEERKEKEKENKEKEKYRRRVYGPPR